MDETDETAIVLAQLKDHMRNAAISDKIGSKKDIFSRVTGVIGYAACMHANAHMIIEKITGHEVPFTKEDAIAYSAFLAGLSFADEDPATGMAILREITDICREDGSDSVSVLIGKAAAELVQEWKDG